MKKSIIKIVAVILSLSLLIVVALPVNGSMPDDVDMTVQTECGGDCEHYPTIVVPGILQSQVYLQNEDGTDMLASDGMPIMEAMDMRYFVDAEKFSGRILDIIFPALLMLLTGFDFGLTDTLTAVLDEQLAPHYFNEDGTRITPIKVQEYYYSLEEADNYPDKFSSYTGKNRTQLGAAIKEVDVSEIGEIAGYDHLYYFFYESFGDIYDIAQRLNSYIDMVKSQTGHDKVNIVFISLGGAVGTAYLDLYYDEANNVDEISEDFNRILFVAAALDGTTVMSDVFGGNFTLTDYELLYSDFAPSLLSMFMDPSYEWLGSLLSLVLRLLPKSRVECLENALGGAIQNSLVKNMFSRCSTMWALIPSVEYPGLADKYLSSSAAASLKDVTDRYHKAQLDNPEQIRSIVDNTDIEIFNICGYGLDIPSILESYYTETSDNIINTSSTSMGAVCAKPGTTLGDDYKPAIDESYISPDGIIDAGAGYLPDHTWYVYGQSHLELQGSKDVIHMCVMIAADESITDARVNNGGYPQFNTYRDSKELYKTIGKAGGLNGYNEQALNEAEPTDEQRAEFVEAYENAVTVYNKTVWNPEESDAAILRLQTVMGDIGLIEVESPAAIKTGNFFAEVFNFLLDAANNVAFTTMGDKSFWDLITS